MLTDFLLVAEDLAKVVVGQQKQGDRGSQGLKEADSGRAASRRGRLGLWLAPFRQKPAKLLALIGLRAVDG
jgi:hypothetical protein